MRIPPRSSRPTNGSSRNIIPTVKAAIRAAEINRTYRELRTSRNLKDPLELNEEWAEDAHARRRGWLGFVAIAVVSAAGVLVLAGPLGPSADAGRSSALHRSGALHGHAAADPMDQPLHVAAITASARRALYMAGTRDEMALASASRDCHHELRNE